MKRTKTSLDNYDIIPEDMEQYLRNYGKHFNKKMYEWAVSMMYKESGTKIKPISKETLENKCQQYNIKLDNDCLYDGCYVYSMCEADFLGSSIVDEMHKMLFVKDMIDDPDAVDGFIFNRFYSDCCLKGEPIDWEGLI